MPTKPRLTPKQLEEMYDSGDNRVTQERNDFLLPQILDFVKEKKWMNIRPEYQRRLVWDRKKKSRFIESLLMNIPIPPIFLYETDLSRYEVMDGQQRLNAIIEFYDNQLKLTGLQTWKALNGYTFHRCPPRIQKGLDRRRISATVLLAENTRGEQGDRIRREVFERLNQGGQVLNPQELRNSLYSGPFNDMVIELAGFRLFDEIWGIPPYEDNYQKDANFISKELADNDLFARMKDCEIVLRFFALRDETNIRGAIRNMLDRYMKDHLAPTSDELSGFKTIFKECLAISHDIFGQKTFKIKKESKWTLSIPLYDGVMIAVEKLREHRKVLVNRKAAIHRALEAEFGKDKSYEILVGKPNTADATKARLSLVHNILKKFV